MVARPELDQRPQLADLADQRLQRGEPGLRLRVLVLGMLVRPRRDHDRLPGPQALPHLLGDERHDRVQQPERSVEHPPQRRPGVGALPAHRFLRQLQPPVGQLVPEEPLQRLRGRVEPVALQRRVDLPAAQLVPREHPPLDQPELLERELRCWRTGLPARGQHEPGRVPDLVGEVAAGLDGLLGQREVLLVGAGHARHGEPQRVGAVALDHVQRVDHVAEGLAHLAPGPVADEPVDHHVPERDVVHEVEPGHDHPGHPQVQDLVARDEHRRRIEELEVRGLFRPAQR